MARKPRVEFEGALYHVIVRRNHRRDSLATEAIEWPTLIGSSSSESAIASSCTPTCWCPITFIYWSKPARC